MPFDDKEKLKALAIVHVFETSKPFGDYSAVAVLNDGAGCSYGINQFTHRSGSLYAVINTYLGEGGKAGSDVFEACLDQLRSKKKADIVALSGNSKFKSALKAAGRTPEMRLAQQQIMENMYLLPALNACEGSNFGCPLSLAVIYDSINHGSFEKIRDRVTIDRSGFVSDEAFEKAWIAEYVAERHRWLNSVPRLRSTNYRTAFFLKQIADANWQLALPVVVHGVRLTDRLISAAVPAVEPTETEVPQSPSTSNSGSQVKPPEDTPPPTDRVAVEKEPEPQTFFQRKKKQITGWIASLGGIETARQYQADVSALGIPGEVFKYAIVLGLVAFLIWLLYGLAVHLWHKIGSRMLTAALVKANATPTNEVHVVDAEKIADLEAAGWTVVRRS